MIEREPLKEIFNASAVTWLADTIASVRPDFAPAPWVARIVEQLPPLALYERVDLIRKSLQTALPDDFPQALACIEAALGPPTPCGPTADSGQFRVLPLLRYISTHGLAYPEQAVPALGRLTRHFSAEFDIRPFLIAHQAYTLARMQQWADDPDARVRRLVSEGSRPRLPWGLRLQAFVADPEPTLALITLLRDDPDPVVRRSVANHLNDIAKDHPDRVAAVAQDWMTDADAPRRALLRHGLRTLVKRGHAGALAALGFATDAPVRLVQFSLDQAQVAFGDGVRFTATLVATGTARLSIDYAIHHRKSDGTQAPKVFKLTTRSVAAGESVRLEKRHALRPITTRRYYAGGHDVELLVNGHAVARATFDLVMPEA
jgi:3-methyladenine DNA glycosylase AlkC